jgi:hypothetical protein
MPLLGGLYGELMHESVGFRGHLAVGHVLMLRQSCTATGEWSLVVWYILGGVRIIVLRHCRGFLKGGAVLSGYSHIVMQKTVRALWCLRSNCTVS